MGESRRIMLTLGSTTDAIWCGDCPSASDVHENDAPDWVVCDVFTDMVAHKADRKRKRLRVCMEAEALAARMVEIAPEDAVRVEPMTFAKNDDNDEHWQAAERVDAALRLHAAKAEVQDV
jgi:hypothetical protein